MVASEQLPSIYLHLCIFNVLYPHFVVTLLRASPRSLAFAEFQIRRWLAFIRAAASISLMLRSFRSFERSPCHSSCFSLSVDGKMNQTPITKFVSAAANGDPRFFEQFYPRLKHHHVDAAMYGTLTDSEIRDELESDSIGARKLLKNTADAFNKENATIALTLNDEEREFLPADSLNYDDDGKLPATSDIVFAPPQPMVQQTNVASLYAAASASGSSELVCNAHINGSRSLVASSNAEATMSTSLELHLGIPELLRQDYQERDRQELSR